MTQPNATTTTLDHQIGPRGRFMLRQASGEIRIRGVEGDRVRVRSLDDRALDEQFKVETGDGFVELRQIEKFGLGIRMFGGGGDSPEIAIEVPHGATVLVETASADLEASDLSGRKEFKTASGDLRLSRFAGGLEVQTVSGDVELEGQAPLDLGLKTISGDVKVRVPLLRRLEMSTTSGDLGLDAELAGGGPFAIRSISGDVLIVARSGFRVEAESITGDLTSDVPSKRESMPGRKVMIVGRPGPTLEFRSVSGDLHVVQPRDAGMESIAPAPGASEAPALVSNAASREAGAGAPAPGGPEPTTDPNAATRLAILRELERGDITVAEATERLGQLDEVLR
jgi:hypothetical protein